MKLLLTGFEPFLGEKINPSQKLVEAISEDPEFQSWVSGLVLPVSFKKAPDLVMDAMTEGSFDAVLMLGQASGRDKISLERTAVNWVETTHADENGYRPPVGRIDSQAEQAFFSDWPLDKMKKKLEDKKIPVEISFTAGAFVCNYLYFRTSCELSLMKKSSLFVHVPYLPEQVVGKPGTASMDFSVMKAGLVEILRACLS